jgi:hypothetical protein
MGKPTKLSIQLESAVPANQNANNRNMRRLCPHCHRPVYSQNIFRCGYCGSDLPADLFTEGYVAPVFGPKLQAPSILDDYRTLSLPARLAVGIHCFERYCNAKGLRHPMISDFINHMWELPCAKSFTKWESQACEFVHVGLGDPFPPEIVDLLRTVTVTEEEFRGLVESVVEIIYSSAYGASDDARSLKYLGRVLFITASVGVTPPPARSFLISLFDVRHGWGPRLEANERDIWRYRAYENLET